MFAVMFASISAHATTDVQVLSILIENASQIEVKSLPAQTIKLSDLLASWLAPSASGDRSLKIKCEDAQNPNHLVGAHNEICTLTLASKQDGGPSSTLFVRISTPVVPNGQRQLGSKEVDLAFGD